jgi:hypothetical protein
MYIHYPSIRALAYCSAPLDTKPIQQYGNGLRKSLDEYDRAARKSGDAVSNHVVSKSVRATDPSTRGAGRTGPHRSHKLHADRRQQDSGHSGQRLTAEFRPTSPRQLWFGGPKSGGERGPYVHPPPTDQPPPLRLHGWWLGHHSHVPAPCSSIVGVGGRESQKKTGAYRGQLPGEDARRWGSRRPGSGLGDGSHQKEWISD